MGLEAQLSSLESFVPAGAEILEQFTEIESGKKNERPELANALALAKQHDAILIIAKLDRLARNVAFIANLLESGVEIVAVDMPQANKFMLHVMAAVAEQEALMISQRTKAALAAAKKKGVKLGWANPKQSNEQQRSSAAGTRTNIKKADVFALSMFAKLCELNAAGVKRPSEIAKALNDSNVLTARGGRWHPSTVKNLSSRIFWILNKNAAGESGA